MKIMWIRDQYIDNYNDEAGCTSNVTLQKQHPTSRAQIC